MAIIVSCSLSRRQWAIHQPMTRRINTMAPSVARHSLPTPSPVPPRHDSSSLQPITPSRSLLSRLGPLADAGTMVHKETVHRQGTSAGPNTTSAAAGNSRRRTRQGFDEHGRSRILQRDKERLVKRLERDNERRRHSRERRQEIVDAFLEECRKQYAPDLGETDKARSSGP